MASYNYTDPEGQEFKLDVDEDLEPHQVYQRFAEAGVAPPLEPAQVPAKETPGYLSQLGSALSLGGRQMAAGVKGTFNAAVGDTSDVAEAMARTAALNKEQQETQTAEDIGLNEDFAKNKGEWEKASGVWDATKALGGYAGSIASHPGAAFKQAVQSAPNAIVGTGTSLAGYGLGALAGATAGIETGPGAILSGIAGAAAGGAVSNSMLEAGPAIYDVLNERTNGAAANMTAPQIAEVLKKDPTIVQEGLKTGAIRGSVIGVIEGLGMKGAGAILSIPERAAARAAQKTLLSAGVDIASKEAVKKAMEDTALKKAVSVAAQTAKAQYSTAGNLARGAAATGLETAASGAGEVGAQAAAGQPIDPTAAVQEMMGEVGINAVSTPAVKALDAAKYALGPDGEKVEGTDVRVSPNTLPESAGLGKPVSEVIDEAAVLNARAHEQAVQSGSPLMAEAIARNVAAPDPEAQAREEQDKNPAEPSDKTRSEATDEVNETPSVEDVKATLDQPTSEVSTEPGEFNDTPIKDPGEVDSPISEPRSATIDAATPREQGGSGQHAGESRTPPEGSISGVTGEKVADNKPLSSIDPGEHGVVTLQPNQLETLKFNPREMEQAKADNEQPERQAMDLNKAGPIMAIRQKDGSIRVVQGHHRLARALRDKVPLQVDIINEVSTKPISRTQSPGTSSTEASAKSIPDRINESSLSPRTTLLSLVQDIKNLTGNTANKLQEVADALLPEPMNRPTAEKIARRLMDENQAQRDSNAARDRHLERDMIGEEKVQRGDEKPITDEKAPLTQGEFVTWQDENGVMREGVLTKTNAGRNDLGQHMAEVSLEDSQGVQVPRTELHPLMASHRGNPVQAARAEAIESLRGHLGKEVSVGVPAVDAINGVTDLQGTVPGVQKAWVGTRAEFLADEGLAKAFPQVWQALMSDKSDRFEGLFSGGRAFVFTDQVGVYEGDVEAAKEQGIPAPQAAVQRVITHEALVHRGIYVLDKPTRRALFQWGAQNIYEGEMDAKADEYGFEHDWRVNEGTRKRLMGEIMAKMIERLKAPPKAGPLKQLWDILASIWRKLTGRSREVTLKDIHDVAKLLRTALELAENNVETRDGMPVRVDVVNQSLRPHYTSPLDQTLANTAKAVRLMRDGPPATPVNLQQAYRQAQVGKSSAMVSLDDMFAEAKKAHPGLTEAEFGRQLQALYDDNGAYIEPADSPAVMRESGDKYNVRMMGVPASFAMVLDDKPVMASLAQATPEREARSKRDTFSGSMDYTSVLDPETQKKLQREVWVDQSASGNDSVSDQTKIVDQPDYIKTERDLENTVKTGFHIVDALLAAGVPVNQLPNALIDYGVQKQLGYERDATLLNVLLTVAMKKGAPNATKVFQKERSNMGGGLGVAAFLHKHPEFRDMFMFDGIEEAHNQKARDIAEVNADIKDTEIKKLDVESGKTVAQEISESAEDAAFRQGEEGLSAANKLLWRRVKDRITRIGFALQKLAGLEAKSKPDDVKPSLAGVVTPAEIAAMDNMTADQLRAFIAKEQKELTADLKNLMGEGKKTKGAKTGPSTAETRRIATLVSRLSDQLGVPTGISTAVEALTASQDNLRNQFEQGIVDSLVGRVRSAVTPKQKPSKNLNSVIRQITRILGDNLSLPKNTIGQESLGEKAIDAFGRVRSNEQLIREAWEKAREQIRATLAKRATEGLEGLTEEEAADIEQQVDEQLAAIAVEVPAHLWARGQAYGVLRDALEDTEFDNNTKILADPAGALKAARDKINAAVEKVGNVDMAQWNGNKSSSNQLFIDAAFNALVADLRAAKAKAETRRRAVQRAGVFSPAETKTFNRLMDTARKRSGDKTPMQPENISWHKLFSGSPQSQADKAKAMMDYMKQDPVLSHLDPAEQQELADMFAKRWEAKRTELTDAKVAAVLKRRHATDKGKDAVKKAIPHFIQAINRGELTNDIIAQEIAQKFGFEKLTDAENKRLETLSKELQQPDIPVHERRAKTDEMVKIIARKTGLSTAEILSAWWVTSVLSGPRTIFTIGMAFLSGGFEVFTHAVATVVNAHLQGRRSKGVDAAVQSITNYFKSYPRAVQLAWQYVMTGDKNLLADSDPAFMQFFDTGRNNPQSVGWRMTQSQNPATRTLGRFMHFFEKMLTAGDLFNSTITRHGMLPVAQFLNSKSYDKARVASETDLSNYRKTALDKWWGGEEPKTAQQQALVTRQAIDLMEADLAKYANTLEDANFVAAQSAMTLNPEGLGGKFYKAIRGIANRAESSSAKAVKAADMLKAGEVGRANKLTQQAIAFLYHFATHQMLNLGGLRFARFAGNKLNQSIGFIPVLGLARLYEKDYAGQIKKQAIIKNQVIGAVIVMVGISILKAISDEPDDEKRGWGWEGSWAGLSAAKIKQLMAVGLKPNSIHFNGHVFNYSNWPISSMLAAIGSVADRIKYAPEDWGEATTPDMAYTGLWAAMSSTFDTSALSQLAEILGSNVHSRDPVDASIKKVSRVFGNFAGGFVPRVLKDVDLMQDGHINKYEGWGNFAKEIPFYRRYVGGPLLDVFGKQVETSRTPWGREYSQQPEAKEYRLLGQMGSNGLWLPPADPGNRRVGRGKRSREMTDVEQKRFVTLVGDRYRDLVLKHGERLNKMGHDAAKDKLGKLSAQARDSAERQAISQ